MSHQAVRLVVNHHFFFMYQPSSFFKCITTHFNIFVKPLLGNIVDFSQVGRKINQLLSTTGQAECLDKMQTMALNIMKLNVVQVAGNAVKG